MPERQSISPAGSPMRLTAGQELRFALEHKDTLLAPCPDGKSARAFLRQRFVTAPIFNFHADVSRAAVDFSLLALDVLGRLAGDIRLPFPAMILVMDNRALCERGDAIVAALAAKAGQPPPRVRDFEGAGQRSFLLYNPDPSSPRIDVLTYGALSEIFADGKASGRWPRRGALMMPWRWTIDPLAAETGPLPAISPFAASAARLMRKGLGPEANASLEDLGDRRFACFAFDGEDATVDHVALATLAIGSGYRFAVERDFAKATARLARMAAIKPPPWPWGGRELGDVMLTDPDGEPVGPAGKAADVVASELTESVGDIRLLIAALALFNLRDRVVVHRPPARPAGLNRYGSRTAPYLAETAVELVLPAPKVIEVIRAFDTDRERASPRRHEVRGHWCQSRNDRVERCFGHVWVDVDADRKRCERCGAKRWFRKAHARGDATRGFVRREAYDVVTDGRAQR